jgi:hypothetical protein
MFNIYVRKNLWDVHLFDNFDFNIKKIETGIFNFTIVFWNFLFKFLSHENEIEIIIYVKLFILKFK